MILQLYKVGGYYSLYLSQQATNILCPACTHTRLPSPISLASATSMASSHHCGRRNAFIRVSSGDWRLALCRHEIGERFRPPAQHRVPCTSPSATSLRRCTPSSLVRAIDRSCRGLLPPIDQRWLLHLFAGRNAACARTRPEPWLPLGRHLIP